MSLYNLFLGGLERKSSQSINHTLGKMVLSYLDACEQIEAGYYDWSPVNWNAAMLITVKIDNKQLMEYFINKGANDWNDGMIIAVKIVVITNW